MNFKKGDIIGYCNEFFEVDTNYGSSGSVWEVNDKFERTGVFINNFHWSAYGEDCKLIKSN
ncbi:hypothetical protein BAOM_2967 [Peribacillus asahii]|uniref:YopX protein domain-containing protein n=1 Tax=Peribacillus asahii TaxID=228899 RepID=A0A3T0KT39_9BACI|nr:hypothetical protein [Peribacillus asahii]AZV43576.1 hypothetical protein BAOM_2967 [Peribacillus asahii]